MQKGWIGLGLLVVAGCTQAPPPEEKAAIDAVLKIESALSIGVNYLEYKSLVSDAQVAFDAYSRTGKTKEEIVVPLTQVMANHRIALTYWQCSIENSEPYDSFCRHDKMKELGATYPVLAKFVEGKGRYYFDGENAGVQLIWQLDNQAIETLQAKKS